MGVNLKLKGAMAEADFTIEKLAEMIGLKAYSLSRRINGHIDFSEKEITSICSLLNKTPTELFFNNKLTVEQ